MFVLMLAAAASQTVLDAERAFAKLAQEKGQWTAFRATAAPDAVMFVPQPVNAQDWLKDKRDPPKSVKWWPTKAWQSCDGTLAVTTGGALWPDGRHGWFTTVWKRQADGGWKWVLDHGGDVKFRLKGTHAPEIFRANCNDVTEVNSSDAMQGGFTGGGASCDFSLSYGWAITAETSVLDVSL